MMEYVPSHHMRYTCFTWLVTENTMFCIASGTSEGGVVLYLHSKKKVDDRRSKFHVLLFHSDETLQQQLVLNGNGHAGAVTSICLHENCTLYTSGEDCCIFEWSLTRKSSVRKWSIGETAPAFIASLPMSNRLLVGCKKLSVWSKDELQFTLKGHYSAVNSMKILTVEREDYAITTDTLSRDVFLWKIDGKREPMQKFSMKCAPALVCCSVAKAFGLTIAAIADRANGEDIQLFIVDDFG